MSQHTSFISEIKHILSILTKGQRSYQYSLNHLLTCNLVVVYFDNVKGVGGSVVDKT